jgi:arginase
MTAQGRRVSILGAPTSAGSHNPGQEKAPAAWRAAGLIDDLRAAGLDVEDRGDLPATPYRPVEPVDGLRDLERVVAVAQGVAGEVAAIRTELVSRHLYAAPATAVRADPAGQARQARTYLEGRTGAYLVHLDVDVLHTGLFPLANFPHFAGLTLDQVSVCLNEFTSGAKFGGLVITEVNPDHDPDGQLIKSLSQVVAGALAAG